MVLFMKAMKAFLAVRGELSWKPGEEGTVWVRGNLARQTFITGTLVTYLITSSMLSRNMKIGWVLLAFLMMSWK